MCVYVFIYLINFVYSSLLKATCTDIVLQFQRLYAQAYTHTYIYIYIYTLAHAFNELLSASCTAAMCCNSSAYKHTCIHIQIYTCVCL